MNGLSVGGWHDIVDPGRARMGMVETFNACISDRAMGPIRSDELDGTTTNVATTRPKRQKW